MGAFNDYRRMRIRINHIDGPGTVQSLPGIGRSVRIHRGYYYIDDMVPIPPPAGATPLVFANRGSPDREREVRLFTKHMLGVDEVIWRVERDRCALEIHYPATRSLSALAPSQVWLLRGDGTAIAPVRAAVMSGDGFGGTGPPHASYVYDRAVAGEAVAIVVKLGDEYLMEMLRR
jgi:hypothetical protein